ncbi:T9SS type A sorting domain-containing protein [Flavobacterium sp. 5]|uniref:T9SS type A sorting domain-containing protein n=1 Tax=Flavobacterium sp. 5 TaxID=2035199 RepID=UPI000C2C8D35|nr:T9SS type A sorting domain-containing protein [Flavobacterium sp. 5]PKB15071.1 hypothetical protein CLU82_0126 [Flavobacterium sp. 5]
MKTVLPKFRFLTVVFLIVNLFFANVVFSQEIKTDLLDYPPGATAMIIGSGFQANETVTLQVTHEGDDPGGIDEVYHQPWTVLADGNGNVNASWYIPTDGDSLGAVFLLTANGQSSGLHAEWTFKDANSTLTNPTPTTAVYGSVINITSTLTQQGGNGGCLTCVGNGNAIPGKTVAFTINGGTSLGSAITNVSGVASLTYSVIINAGSFTGSNGLKGTFAGDPSNNPYSGSSGTNNFTVTKATTILSAVSGTGVYGSSATLTATTNLNVAGIPVTFSLDGTVVGVGNTNASGLVVLAVPFASIPVSVRNAGTYAGKVGVSLANTANYSAGTATGNLVISKADQTITVGTPSPANAVYGTNFTVAATASSGLTVVYTSTAPLSNVLGVYTMNSGIGTGIVKYNQAGNTNYNAAPEVTANVAAVKANSTISINPAGPFTYNSLIQGPETVTKTGSTGAVTYSYVGVSGTNYSDIAKPINAGSYEVTATVATDNDYNSATSAPLAFAIAKADAVVTVTGYTGVYDAGSHGASGSAVGVAGDLGASGSTLNLGSSFTNVPGGAASWTFTGGTNYNNQNGTAAIVISQAPALIVVNGYAGIYDAAAHGATLGSATGVGGADLSSSVTIDPLTYTNYPGGTVGWSFAENNYVSQSGSADIAIAKADAVVTVTGYTGVYDAGSHGASGSAVGVAGDLGASGSTLNLGSSFTNVPGGTASWTFTGGTNYNNQNGTAAIVISQAPALIVVNGYAGIYDAAAHGATLGSATGVGGADLSSSVTIDPLTYTNYPGGTVGWSFAENNYVSQSGSADIAIAKADAVVTVTGYTGVYDAGSHGASGSAVGVAGDLGASGSTLNLGSSFTNVPGGTASWTFTGGTNYNNQNGTAAIVISQAPALIVVNGYAGIYDATAHGATLGSATGVGGADLSSSVTIDPLTYTNYPGGTVGWSFAENNYVSQSGSADIAIAKADAVVTVTSYTGVYDAGSHGASGSAVGVAGDLGASGSTLNLGSSFTNVPGGTASWTFTGGTNYNNQNGTAAIVISQAPALIVVNGYAGIYDAAAHGATLGSATGVGGADLSSSVTIDPLTYTNYPGGTVGWSFAENNYVSQSGSADIAIAKADAVVTVTGYTGVYDAGSHGASGSAVGVAGDLGASGSTLNLGSSFTNVPGGTASWTFTGGTNYNNQNGTAAIVISQAPALIVVNGYAGIYDAAAHGATLGSATGVGGADLSSSVTIDPLTYTNYPGGTVGWSFAENNYVSQSGSADIAIAKADAVVTVTGYTGVYDAGSHGASGSAVGVAGDLGASGSTLNLGLSFTNVPGGTASWTFTGGTNYNNQNGTAAIVISQAPALIVVNGYAGIYDAAAHGATLGSATGVGGADLSSSVTIDPLTYTNYPGGTVGWSFAENNYVSQSGSADIAIAKADAVVTVTGYTGVYDAGSHGASGSAVGVAGDLGASGSTLNLGLSFTNVPGGTASWTFTGGTNYNNQNGTAAIVISQAPALIVVNGYAGIYDATAHGATLGSATGVGGADLSSSVTIDPLTYTNYPGGTVGWSFAENNYVSQSGSADIAIAKADAVVTVTGYTGVYDAGSHGASGSAVGVAGDLGASGSTLNLGLSFTNVPGGTASWTFTGGTNYNNQNGTAAIVISQAPALIVVNGYAGIYDATAHGATLGSATGVGGADLSSSVTIDPLTYTNYPGGTVGWSFAENNYVSQSGSADIAIAKADAVVTVTGYTGVYDAGSHGASGSAVGVAGDLGASGSTLNLGSSFTNVPGGTASWTFTGGTNYNNQNGTAAIVISQAPALIVVNGYAGIYDAAAHGATLGSATGVGGADLSSSVTIDPLTYTNYPGGTVGWSFAENNYVSQSGSADIAIAKADAVVTVTGYTGVYDAGSHGASGSAVGVAGDLGASGSTLNLGLSFTNVPGGTASWTFTGGTNYNNQNGTAAIVISQAPALIVVNGYAGIYDAAAHGATLGSATGVGGADLSSSVTIDPLTYTNYPGGTVGWSFAENNYVSQSGSADIAIAKADAVVTVTGYTGVYDAGSHGASGSAVGVAGDLGASGSTLNLGLSFTNVPGGTASWTFTGGTNYNNQNGTAAIVISQAPALIVVNGYAGIYDATAHGATLGSATGVGGADLSSSVTIDPLTYTNYPGGTVGWSFAENNYVSQSGSADIAIAKADAVVTVTGYTGVYDAGSHGASGSAVGVAGDLGASGSTLNLGLSFTNVPGGTASWTFTGGTNYNNQNGTAAIVISQAPALIVVNGYAGIYDATAHGATLGSATGVGGADLSSSVTIDPLTYTNYPGGTVGWSFAENNYVSQSGSVNITITAPAVTIGAPASVSASACTFANQAAVNTVFNNWLAQFSVSGGCSATGSYGSSVPPTFCSGGTTTVTYTINDLCTPSTVTKTFEVIAAPEIVLTVPVNKTVACCQSQAAINISYNAWLASVSSSGGCNLSVTNNSTAIPLACGGSVTVEWKAKSNCSIDIVKYATFTVLPTTLSATIATNNSSLYYGYAGDQSAIITATPSGGTAPYTVKISMMNGVSPTVAPAAVRVSGKLICNFINSTGNEAWSTGLNTNSGLSTGITCSTNSVGASSTSIPIYGSYSVNVVLLTDARFVATVTDANGCFYTIPYELAARVDAEDARCFAGNSGVVKVAICHQTGSSKNPCTAICVDQSAVQEHLNHGDFLGKCTNDCKVPVSNAKLIQSDKAIVEEPTQFIVKVFPNPTYSQFTLILEGGTSEKIELEVYDMLARKVKSIEKNDSQPIVFGEEFPVGEYIVLIRQGINAKTVSLIKQ